MSDIYSDEEFTEESSIDSLNDEIKYTPTEYFNESENIVLKSIIGDCRYDNFNITKNSKLIKLDTIESTNDKLDYMNSSNNVQISIYISTIELIKERSEVINPLIFVDSITKKDYFNDINIILSKITATSSTDSNKKIKLYYGSPMSGQLIEKILDNSCGRCQYERFEKFISDKIKKDESLTSKINLAYLEIFYYVIILIRNKIKNKKISIEDEEFKYDDMFGIYNRYQKFDKSDIDYIELNEKLNSTKTETKIIKNKIDNIPKNLLYTRKQIVDILINQIKQVNENKEYKHFINNIKDSNNLEFEMNIITSKNITIKLLLTIDSDLHPFYPPKLKIISPNVKLNLAATISNLDILKIDNWNPTINFELLIKNLANNLDNIDEFISNDNKNIEKLIMEFSLLIGEKVESLKFNFDYKKYKVNDNSDDNKYWKSGVGYGYSGRNNWDIKEYIKESENKQAVISYKLQLILDDFKNYENKYLSDLFGKKDLAIIKYLKTSILDTTLLEINKNVDIYSVIIKILPKIFTILEGNEDWKLNICEGIKSIRDDISIILETIEDEKKLNLYVSFISLYDTIKEEHDRLIFKIIVKKEETDTSLFKTISTKKSKSQSEIISEYSNMVSTNQKDIFTDLKFDKTHRFYDDLNSKLSNKTILRITSELSSLKKNLPNNWDTSVVLKTSQKNLNLITFVISGPEGTPYHNGIFEFHGLFPADYPNKEPKILLDTTGNGSVRFNPNLYNCGKVCLSLLGTWNGSGAEKWNPSTSTLLQVIVSIQSLILVTHPYFNEPGWERQMHSMEGKKKSQEYSDNIRIQTLKWGIIDKIKNPPKGFEDFTKEHFRLKKKEILNVVKTWLEESKYTEEMTKLRRELIELLRECDDNIQSSSEKSDSEFNLDSKLVPLKNSKYDSKLSLTDSNNSDSIEVVSVDLETDSLILPINNTNTIITDSIDYDPSKYSQCIKCPPPPKPMNQTIFFTPTTPPDSPPTYQEDETQTELSHSPISPGQINNTFMTDLGYHPFLYHKEYISPIEKVDVSVFHEDDELKSSSESNKSLDI